MKRYRLNIFSIFFAAGCLTSWTPSHAQSLANIIASKDLAAATHQEFIAKLENLTQLGKHLVEQQEPSLTSDARELGTRLSTFLDLYSSNKSLVGTSSQAVEDAYTLLKKLIKVYRLKKQAQPIKIEDAPALPRTAYENVASLLRPRDPARMTQDEAFFSQSPGSLTAASLTPRLEDLLARVINQERRQRDMAVFYHGQNNIFAFLYDLDDALRAYASQEPTNRTFAYLRVPGKSLYNMPLAEVLRLGFDADSRSAIRDLLLSVNLALFAGPRGESTWDYYFLKSHSEAMALGLSPKAIINSFLNAIVPQVPQEFLEQLERLYQASFTMPEGSLLQIFIPEDKVNDYVYLSFPYGTPLACKEGSSLWKKCAKLAEMYPISPITSRTEKGEIVYHPRNLDTQTYLKLYKTNAGAVGLSNMNNIQGRILLTNDFMLNPKSGVKIYRYTLMSSQDRKNYLSKLKELIAQWMPIISRSTCQPCPELTGAADLEIIESEMEFEHVARCLTTEAENLVFGQPTTNNREHAQKIYDLLLELSGPRYSRFSKEEKAQIAIYDSEIIRTMLADVFHLTTSEEIDTVDVMGPFKYLLDDALDLVTGPIDPDARQRAMVLYYYVSMWLKLIEIPGTTMNKLAQEEVAISDSKLFINQAKSTATALAEKFGISSFIPTQLCPVQETHEKTS